MGRIGCISGGVQDVALSDQGGGLFERSRVRTCKAAAGLPGSPGGLLIPWWQRLCSPSMKCGMDSCGISLGPASRGDSIERDRARTRERWARIRQATPRWLTAAQHSEIKAIYAEAQQLTSATGRSHHVDHIVPIWGENVRGLHVPWNLRVVTAVNNLRKTNRMVC